MGKNPYPYHDSPSGASSEIRILGIPFSRQVMVERVTTVLLIAICWVGSTFTNAIVTARRNLRDASEVKSLFFQMTNEFVRFESQQIAQHEFINNSLARLSAESELRGNSVKQILVQMEKDGDSRLILQKEMAAASAQIKILLKQLEPL